MATATLISSSNNGTGGGGGGGDSTNLKYPNGHKLHYTVKPYIIDNQVQSSMCQTSLLLGYIMLLFYSS